MNAAISGDIEKIVAEHEIRITKLEKKLAAIEAKSKIVRSKQKGISLKEFLKEKKPKGYTQTTLAIGFYLENYDGLTSFNVGDLDRGFRAAKEPQPKNLNDTANQNIKNGHIMECKAKKDAKKSWVLTASGEEFVENGFENKKK